MKKILNNIPTLITDYLGMAIALLVLIIYFSLSARNFFTLTTFRTIASQVPDITIVAVGMTFALIIAGIDLSVGSVLAVSGAVLAVFLTRAVPPFTAPLSLPAAIPIALAVGAVCGLLNGAVIVRWKLPSFIVTLGMLEIARGATYRVTDSQAIYIGSSVQSIAETSVLGLPLPFIIAVAIVIIGQIVLSCTVFGRYLIAIGTNEQALRLSGVNPKPYKIAVFTICGILAAVAAVTQTSRLGSLDPNTGSGLELQAIAAVVIGGTSLMGGRGSVISTFFGVLIIAVLDTGLFQVGAAGWFRFGRVWRSGRGAGSEARRRQGPLPTGQVQPGRITETAVAG